LLQKTWYWATGTSEILRTGVSVPPKNQIAGEVPVSNGSQT